MLGRGNNGQRDGPLGKIVKTLAAGVGLASETYQHQKAKKASSKQSDNQESGGPGEPPQQARSPAAEMTQEEEVWQLDELQDELAQEAPSDYVATASDTDIAALADSFVRIHPPAPSSSREHEGPAARLALPVVITQRRPKDRTRGFVRAYAPMLQDVGIDQAAFLDFLDRLNQAVRPSPWIQAINLASLAVQHVPAPVMLAASLACKLVADAAASAHSRAKTNAFLDRVNDAYFEPRGLVALLVTWQPSDASSIVTEFGLDPTISQASSGARPQGSGSSTWRWKHHMQSSSGASSFEFPETAPLVFPALDEALQKQEQNKTSDDDDDPTATAEASKKQESVLKRGGAFLADYQDRRAVAAWAGRHPDSKVATAAPAPEFRSRYADPNHAASSGDVLAFVTGGKVSGQERRQNRGGPLARMRVARAERRDVRRSTRGAQGGGGGGIGGVVNGVRGLLQSVSVFSFSFWGPFLLS